MKISKEGIAITKRFFEAVDMLKAQRRIRGLKTFMRKHNITRTNIANVRKNPDRSVLKPEWIYYLVYDYGVSLEWIIFGEGSMFK